MPYCVQSWHLDSSSWKRFLKETCPAIDDAIDLNLVVIISRFANVNVVWTVQRLPPHSLLISNKHPVLSEVPRLIGGRTSPPNFLNNAVRRHYQHYNGRFRQSTLATSHTCARHAQVLLIILVYKSFWMFFEKPSRPFWQINLRSTVEVWLFEYMGLFFSYAIKYPHLVGASFCARSYFLRF